MTDRSLATAHRFPIDESEDLIRYIDRVVEAKLANRLPFQAEAFDVSADPMVQIKRYGFDDEDLQPYPTTAHLALAPGDKLLCIPTDGTTPVVIGKIYADGTAVIDTDFILDVRRGGTTVQRPADQLRFATADFDVSAPATGRADIELFHPPSHGWIVRHCVPNPNATTWQTSLLGAPTVTTPGTSTAADNNIGPFIQLSGASGVSGSVASIVMGTGGNPRGDWSPDLELSIQSSATITSLRYWHGMFASTPSGSSNPSGVSGMGFRFDTGAGDSTWQCWSNDGSGTGTVTNSGVNVTSSTSYRLRCATDGSNVYFWIANNLVATHTVDIPAATTYHPVGHYVTQLSTGQRALRIGRTSIAHTR